MIKKLLKNKFFIGTLILLTGGFFSKLLGFVLRIIITRQIGTYGVSLYSLITPTFGLFITKYQKLVGIFAITLEKSQ